MEILTTEVKEIINSIWAKLYFSSYGAYREGIDKMKAEIDAEIKRFEEEEGKRIAVNYKEEIC